MLSLLLPLLRGVVTTVEVFTGALCVGLCVALLVGLARVSTHLVLRASATVFVTVFRGTSALVQLFWAYFGLPLIGVELGPIAVGVVVLGLNAGAYGAEIVRGAVLAIPREQWEAAQVLGFDRAQTLLRVVLPQALVSMLPPLTNLAIELLKGTALVSLITLSDLTFQARLLRDHTLRTTEVFGLSLLLYFLLATLLSRVGRRLEHKVGAFRMAHGHRAL